MAPLQPVVQPGLRRGTSPALVGVGALVILGIGAVWFAVRTAKPLDTSGEIAVTITDSSCDPASLTVPAGRTTFRIHNTSDRVLEWEILDGVMVLAERENIAPGLSSAVTERLNPGTYQITCGLLSNPHGTLTVVANAASVAAQAKPEARAFVGPLAEYRVYLVRRASALIAATSTLSERIAAGDTDGARLAWLAARQPWQQMAPVTGRIADLVAKIDPKAAELTGYEQDAGFTGFHRIEYGLWVQGSTVGLAPVAAQLATDAVTLKERLTAMNFAPADLANTAAGAATRAADLASSQASYSLTDLADMQGALDGISKSVLLIDPLVAGPNPDASASLHQALATAQATLDGFLVNGAFPPYDHIDAAGRQKIAAAFTALATAASILNPAIGLE